MSDLKLSHSFFQFFPIRSDPSAASYDYEEYIYVEKMFFMLNMTFNIVMKSNSANFILIILRQLKIKKTHFNHEDYEDFLTTEHTEYMEYMKIHYLTDPHSSFLEFIVRVFCVFRG